MLTISDDGLNLIKQFEGFREKSYPDVAGIWTVGYGTIRHLDGRPVKRGETVTPVYAEECLRAEVNKIGVELARLLPPLGLPQHKVDALFSFCYNLGVGAFQSSTLLKAICGTANGGVVTERMFTDWCKARDPKTGALVPVQGLLNRRKAEYALYNS